MQQNMQHIIDTSDLSLGDSDKYTKPKVNNLFKLESMIAPYITGQEDALKDLDRIEKQYNVYKLDKLDELAPKVKIKYIMKDAKLDGANKIILSNPEWLKALNDIYKEENLQLIKDYIEINNIAGIAGGLGEDFQKAQEEFSKQYCA